MAVVDVLLTTERLSLRRFTPDDLALLVELDSDPEVMRWLTGGRPTPAEAVEHGEVEYALTRAEYRAG
jgi:RimJ/RimL family protein N-acetyltransferase